MLARRLILNFHRFPVRRFCTNARLSNFIHELSAISRQQPATLFSSNGNQNLAQASPISSPFVHGLIDRKIEQHEAKFQEIVYHMNLIKRLDSAVLEVVSQPSFDNSKHLSTLLSLYNLRSTIQPPIYHYFPNLESLVPLISGNL